MSVFRNSVKQIEQVNKDIRRGKAAYDLNKAAELQYGKTATTAETAGGRGRQSKR